MNCQGGFVNGGANLLRFVRSKFDFADLFILWRSSSED